MEKTSKNIPWKQKVNVWKSALISIWKTIQNLLSSHGFSISFDGRRTTEKLGAWNWIIKWLSWPTKWRPISDPTVIILCGRKQVFLDPFQANWKVFKPKKRTDSPLGQKLSNIKHQLTCPGPQLAMTFDSCFKPTFQSHCQIHASKKSHPQGYSPSLSIYFWPFIRVNTLHLTTARGTHYLSTLEMPAMRSCRTSNLKVYEPRLASSLTADKKNRGRYPKVQNSNCCLKGLRI